ncbi:pirin family protein [Prosthecochloris sp. ZM_2]|uniref:pirin family protein n=4 Tax=Prosthecochloris TaxID=1101 RepID=UPI000DF783C5|nr:pirin family protein [Prosthecochloris sp. ZM_2]RNA71129.1 pirin family protein [Prosthecochloris sp. ZM_2]
MNKPRSIKRVQKGKPVTEGAGVHLNRVFGYSDAPRFDPFLLLDDFTSNDPQHYLMGFPWHPHRGIETVTYLLEGSIEHRDSLGNNGIIHPGGIQWMTAGSGIIHEEMPLGSNEGIIAGFQLWVNLPASDKLMPPRYRDIPAADIPELHQEHNITLRLISGTVDNTTGPVTGIAVDPLFLDVIIPPETAWNFPVPGDHAVFTYTIAGSAYFSHNTDTLPFDIVDGTNYFDMETNALTGSQTVVLYDSDGDHLHIETSEEPVRFLLIAGKPLDEPIAWHGPIVMNTEEELRQAFDDYEQGRFVNESDQ